MLAPGPVGDWPLRRAHHPPWRPLLPPLPPLPRSARAPRSHRHAITTTGTIMPATTATATTARCHAAPASQPPPLPLGRGVGEHSGGVRSAPAHAHDCATPAVAFVPVAFAGTVTFRAHRARTEQFATCAGSPPGVSTDRHCNGARTIGEQTRFLRALRTRLGYMAAHARTAVNAGALANGAGSASTHTRCEQQHVR